MTLDKSFWGALDEAQQDAVNHYNGPAMILAGPGSGKTTVITNRVRNLIDRYKVSPDKILVITFTKKAALEMQERYLKLTGQGMCEVEFGTFHAVFFMILKHACGYKAEDIIKTSQQREFVSMYLRAKGITVRDEQAFVGDIVSEIAKVKSGPAYVEGFENYKPESCDGALFKELYAEYGKMLQLEHKIDFEDMLVAAYILLGDRKDILKIWQERYEYVLIDEFQDSSDVQFNIVKMLCARHNNIFVVGDDDQSIYGFRGAVPDVMKNFEEFYKGAAVYRLNINYRSTDTIVKAATSVINKNKNRFFKDLMAFNKAGAAIEVIEFKDIEEEGIYIADRIERLLLNTMASGDSKSAERPEKNSADIAVLTRTNTGAAGIVKKLLRREVKVDYKGKKDEVFGHWIAADIKAFFRIASGKNDRVDYIRVVNKPARGISRVFFTEEKVSCNGVVENMKLVGQDSLAQKFCGLVEDLKYVSGLNPYSAFTYIRKKMGYEQYIKQYAKSYKVDERVLLEMLDRLQKTTVNCINIKQWLDMAEGDADIQNHTKIKEGKMGMRNQKQEKGAEVAFLTMHGAKGLEFDTVFIPDANEGIVPYEKALSNEAVEEERRLFYVAMTRAKRKLVICYTKERYNRFVQPSRFLRELHDCGNVKFYYSSSSSSA